MSLTPKNWKEFQHYTDRKPTWIKLHRTLLDDYQFACLPVASRALAPCLWLLASEYKDGEITASLEEMAFRLHMTPDELSDALHPLIKAGFFTVSSGALAGCYQTASPEKERETEKQVETEVKYGADAPTDSRTELFKRGLETLSRMSGKTPSSVRSLVGRWLKACDDEAIHVLAAIDDAATDRIVDPIPWIEARLRPKFKTRNPNGQAAPNRLAQAIGQLRQHVGEIDGGEEGGGAPPRLLSHG